MSVIEEQTNLKPLDKILESVPKGDWAELIPILQKIQRAYGYLPETVLVELSVRMGFSVSRIYGVVTFYSFFTITPRGRHTIRLCLGTACYVKGAKEMLENIVKGVGINVGETSDDGRFTLEAVRCLGACGLAPVMMVGEYTHGNIQPKDTLSILEGYQ